MKNEELKILERDIKKIDDRLDEHILNYSKNGRELVRLSGLIEEHFKNDQDNWKDIKEVLDYWKGFKYGRRFILGAIGFFTAIGGAIIIWKNIR